MTDPSPPGGPEPDGEPTFEELDPDGQLASLLDAPDRDRCPGARPVVSVDEDDDPAYVAEINARCVAAPRLVRRGVFHGNWAELHDAFAFVPRDPLAVLRDRFDAAQPIVLHDALADEVFDVLVTDRELERLARAGGLRELLTDRRHQLAPAFQVLDEELPGVDERDIERIAVEWSGAGGATVSDLWLKSQRLSASDDDASLRLRVSFGREIEDDASRDEHRHRLVAELSERVLPEVGALVRDGELRGLIGEWIRGRPLFTQSIGYWNAPNGGALFHHDAFDEPARGRQRGVLFAQLTGSTGWLALSIGDLATRVLEFAELLAEGDLPWVREALADEEGSFDALLTLARDRDACIRELGQPGCGALGRLVNFGPEFTSLLADAGHGFVLSPGDVAVLPNHGLAKTCMHSVFCTGEETGFGVSLAIREVARARPASSRRGSSRRRARGRRPGSSRRRRS
ncbi:MAG: hypothetical protein AAGA20_22605 [Planctomycetota bacterium]